MKDFRIQITKHQKALLSKMLPSGFSLQAYRVREGNISNFFTADIGSNKLKLDTPIMALKESVKQSFSQSEKSQMEKPLNQVPTQAPIQVKVEPLRPFQRQCLSILKKLRKHQSSYPFRMPVDPNALGVPEYQKIVLEPIDLKKIQQTVKQDSYQYISQLERDIYKMIMNSYKFNQKQTPVFEKTKQFQKYFTDVMKAYFKELEQEIKQQNTDSIYDPYAEKQQGNSKQKSKEKLKDQIKQRTRVSINKGNMIFRDMVKVQANDSALIRQPSKQKCNGLQKKIKEKKEKLILKKTESVFSQPEQIVSNFSQSIQDHNQVVKAEDNQVSYNNACNDSMLDQMKEMMQDETIRQADQSDLQLTSCQKISNIEVQKGLSNLLKKLSEYPMTKQKKNKHPTKFNMLENGMSSTQKRKLFQKIGKLDQQDFVYVVQILTRNRKELLKQEEFEIDLDKTQNKLLREINNFISLREKQENSFLSNGHFPTLEKQNSNAYQEAYPKKMIEKEKEKLKEKEKEKKKKAKRKPIRKNSDDDSFGISQPISKKKKHTSQNHSKREQPVSNFQKSQSSYKAGVLSEKNASHYNHHNDDNDIDQYLISDKHEDQENNQGIHLSHYNNFQDSNNIMDGRKELSKGEFFDNHNDIFNDNFNFSVQKSYKGDQEFMEYHSNSHLRQDYEEQNQFFKE